MKITADIIEDVVSRHFRRRAKDLYRRSINKADLVPQHLDRSGYGCSVSGLPDCKICPRAYVQGISCLELSKMSEKDNDKDNGRLNGRILELHLGAGGFTKQDKAGTKPCLINCYLLARNISVLLRKNAADKRREINLVMADYLNSRESKMFETHNGSSYGYYIQEGQSHISSILGHT